MCNSMHVAAAGLPPSPAHSRDAKTSAAAAAHSGSLFLRTKVQLCSSQSPAPFLDQTPAHLPPQQRLFVDKRDFIFLVIPPPVLPCGGGCIILGATGLCERARTLHQCPEISYFIFVCLFVCLFHRCICSVRASLRLGIFEGGTGRGTGRV